MNICNAEWAQREDGLLHCTFCGSIDIPDLLVLLITPGVDYSGCDWKYGWPHKFYFNSPSHGRLKFYNAHILEATEDQLVLFNRLAEHTLSIQFYQKDGVMRYQAPYADYQAAGTIGGAKVLG